MERYTKNEDIMMKCFLFIHHICIDSTSNQCTLGLAGIGPFVTKVLDCKKHDPRVVDVCVRTMLSMCAGRVEFNMGQFASHRNLRRYIDIIKLNVSCPEIRESICDVLVKLLSTLPQPLEIQFVKSKIAIDLVTMIQDGVTSSMYNAKMVQRLLFMCNHLVTRMPMCRTEFVNACLLDTLVLYNGSRWDRETMKVVSNLNEVLVQEQSDMATRFIRNVNRSKSGRGSGDFAF
jgi:hypothetical protein